jgi:hypothetical protein
VISPRYGDPCECEACTVAGVRGHRVIAVGYQNGQPVYVHGRELARLERAIGEAQEQLARFRVKEMPK